MERTFAWIGRDRRTAKDYERNTESSKAIIYIAMTARMLKLLKKRKRQLKTGLMGERSEYSCGGLEKRANVLPPLGDGCVKI